MKYKKWGIEEKLGRNVDFFYGIFSTKFSRNSKI
ncbi:MAG: hypothetical protein ACI9L6_001691 [Flavobacterium sp.]|jgi:hypothetical protein